MYRKLELDVFQDMEGGDGCLVIGIMGQGRFIVCFVIMGDLDYDFVLKLWFRDKRRKIIWIGVVFFDFVCF